MSCFKASSSCSQDADLESQLAHVVASLTGILLRWYHMDSYCIGQWVRYAVLTCFDTDQVSSIGQSVIGASASLAALDLGKVH